jgi:hypothetical protein
MSKTSNHDKLVDELKSAGSCAYVAAQEIEKLRKENNTMKLWLRAVILSSGRDNEVELTKDALRLAKTEKRTPILWSAEVPTLTLE